MGELPDVSDFIVHYICWGWVFAFWWHFFIGAAFHWMEALEEVAD